MCNGLPGDPGENSQRDAPSMSEPNGCPNQRTRKSSPTSSQGSSSEKFKRRTVPPSSSAAILVVLRCALDRRKPALAPLHPDLRLGLQLEGRLVQASEANLDELVAEVGGVE